MEFSIDFLTKLQNGDEECENLFESLICDPNNIQTIYDFTFSDEVKNNSKYFFLASTMLKRIIERNSEIINDEYFDVAVDHINNFFAFFIEQQSFQANILTQLCEITYNYLKKYTNKMVSAMINPFFDNFKNIKTNSILQVFISLLTKMMNNISGEELKQNLSQISSDFLVFVKQCSDDSFSVDTVIEFTYLIEAFIRPKLPEIMVNEQLLNSISFLFSLFQTSLDNNDKVDLDLRIMEIVNLCVAICNSKKDKNLENFLTCVFTPFIDLHLTTITDNVLSTMYYVVQNRSKKMDILLSKLITYASNLIMYKKEPKFLTEEFFVNVILNATMLSDDQIYEYFTTPIQFLIYEIQNPVMPYVRSAVLFYISCTRDLIDYTNLLSTLPEDLYEIEAKLFMIRIVFDNKYPEVIENQLMELLEMIPIDDICDFDIDKSLTNIEMIIMKQKDEIAPLILLPTFIEILKNSQIDPAIIRDYAYNIFMQTNASKIILKSVSMELLIFGLENSNEIGNIDLEELIQMILEYINYPVKMSSFGMLIECIINSFNAAESFGLTLLELLFSRLKEEIAAMKNNEEDENDAENDETSSLQEMIHQISNIIKNLPDKDFVNTVEQIVQELQNMLNEFGDDGFPTVIEIFASIMIRTKEVPEFIVALFNESILAEVANKENIVFDMCYFVDIATQMIIKSSDYAQNFSGLLIELLLSFLDIDRDNEEVFMPAYIIMIFTALIYKNSETIEPCLEFVNNIMDIYADEGKYDINCLYSACYFYVTLLKKSISYMDSISQSFTEQIITTTDTNQFDLPKLSRDKAVWLHFLILCIENGNNDLVPHAETVAAKLAKQLIYEKTQNDCYDNYEEEEDDCIVDYYQDENDYFIDEDALLPIDAEDPIKKFANMSLDCSEKTMKLIKQVLEQ